MRWQRSKPDGSLRRIFPRNCVIGDFHPDRIVHVAVFGARKSRQGAGTRGDPGSGLVDEISGQSGFNTPGNDTLYSWTAQAGASLYDVARSIHSDFSGDCTLFLNIVNNYLNDTESPPAGQQFYYLVRAAAPFTGSWGEDEAGVERLTVCP